MMAAKVKTGRVLRLGLLLIVLAIALYTVVGLVTNYVNVAAQTRELEVQHEQQAELEQRVDELNDVLQNGSFENIIEKAAREKLGYVYADEQIYYNLSPGK